MKPFDEAVARRRAEARAAADVAVSEIRPSTRDPMPYLTTGRSGLSVVADLARRRDGERRPASDDLDLVAVARRLDDAEIDAAVVGTDPTLHGADLSDLSAVSTACETLPVIRRDLVFSVPEIHAARLHGADGVIVLPALLDPAGLRDLAAAAASTHMATMASVWDEEGVSRALEVDLRLLEIRADDPRTGERSLDRLVRLAETVPAHLTLVGAGGLDLDEAASLSGLVDGVVLGEVLLAADDPAAVVARLKEAP